MFAQDTVLGLFLEDKCSLVLVLYMALLLVTDLVGMVGMVAMLESLLGTWLVEPFLVGMCTLVLVSDKVTELVLILGGMDSKVAGLVLSQVQMSGLDIELVLFLVGRCSQVLV
jgi:hypothetical protein